jgi:large subunit ribosomal protein L4e
MFAPTKTYRRWHRKINKNQRRFAVVSALAASASTALVMARGHRIAGIPEVPLVLSNESILDVEKTSQAVKILKTLHAYSDVERVKESKKIRSGKGKLRNRRYVQRRGPLIIYHKKSPMIKAFRNIPGIELVNVNRLNLLQLAPGGHIGRFVIWTRGALERLDALYGTYKKAATAKVDYRLPFAKVTNSDLTRIINSDEIQSKLRPVKKQTKRITRKKNPLKNLGALIKLNPYAKSVRRIQLRSEARSHAAKAARAQAVTEAREKKPRNDKQKRRHAHKVAKKTTNGAFEKLLLS